MSFKHNTALLFLCRQYLSSFLALAYPPYVCLLGHSHTDSLVVHDCMCARGQGWEGRGKKKLQALKATGIEVTGDQRNQVKISSIFKHSGRKFTDGVKRHPECGGMFFSLLLGVLPSAIMETLDQSHICSWQYPEGHSWLIWSRIIPSSCRVLRASSFKVGLCQHVAQTQTDKATPCQCTLVYTSLIFLESKEN